METQIRDEINRRLMAAGVTLIDPATAYIAPEVEIGRDTIHRPQRADSRPHAHRRGRRDRGHRVAATMSLSATAAI